MMNEWLTYSISLYKLHSIWAAGATICWMKETICWEYWSCLRGLGNAGLLRTQTELLHILACKPYQKHKLSPPGQSQNGTDYSPFTCILHSTKVSTLQGQFLHVCQSFEEPWSNQGNAKHVWVIIAIRGWCWMHAQNKIPKNSSDSPQVEPTWPLVSRFACPPAAVFLVRIDLFLCLLTRNPFRPFGTRFWSLQGCGWIMAAGRLSRSWKFLSSCAKRRPRQCITIDTIGSSHAYHEVCLVTVTNMFVACCMYSQTREYEENRPQRRSTYKGETGSGFWRILHVFSEASPLPVSDWIAGFALPSAKYSCTQSCSIESPSSAAFCRVPSVAIHLDHVEA